MREGEFLDQPLERARLVSGTQLLALNVLDQRNRERFLIVELANDRRDVGESRELGSSQAALAGDDLELMREAGHRPHNERLDETGGLDRCDEFLEELGPRLAARRLKSGANRLNGDGARRTLSIEATGMDVQERLQLAHPARVCTHGA